MKNIILNIQEKTSLFCAFILLLVSNSVLAQNTVAQPDTLKSKSELKEVPVTARRVEESLQDVPMSITTFSPEELVQNGATQLIDVARFTPGLTIENGQGGAGFGTSIFIRGIGQRDYKGNTDPGVGMYVDGVYIARTIGTLLEMEGANVEVLRGPQGTAFGRNTIGGAINITTANPTTDSVYGSTELTGGNFNLLQFRGSVNLPISKKVAANFSTVYRSRGGYAEGLIQPYQEQGDDNTFFLRGKLRATPSEKLTLDLGFDYTRTDAGSAVSTLLGADTTTSTVSQLYNQLVGNAVDPTWITGDPYTINATNTSVNKLSAYGINGTATLDLGNVKSKLILGHRNMDSRFSRDGDNGPFPYLQANTDFTSVTTSAELQFHNAKPSKFNWLGGLYYMNENNEENAQTDRASGLYEALEAADANDVPGIYGGSGNPANEQLDLSTTSEDEVVANNLAAYMTFSYDFTKKWALSGGLRFSQDDKTYTATHQRIASRSYIVGPGTKAAADWASLSGHGAIEYQANDNGLAYMNFAHGFRSGGFSTRPLESSGGILAYNPETVRTLELGYKSKIGKKTRLNVSGYITDYADIQVDSFTNAEVLIQNGAKGEILGLELELLTTIGKDLHINGSAALTDARYTVVNQSSNLSLESLYQKTPLTQFNIGAAFTPSINEDIDLLVRADYNYQSETYHNPQNTALLLQPAFSLLSARVALTLKNKYEISFWGKNLTNEAVLQGGVASPNLGITEAFYGPPRTIGTSLRYTF